MQAPLTPRYSVNTNRTVIIGNGWDLNLKLRTSFSDFFKGMEFLRIPDSNSLALFARDKLSKNSNWSDLEGALPEWISWVNSMSATRLRDRQETIGEAAEDDFDEVTEAVHSFIRNAQNPNMAVDTRVKQLVQAWGSRSLLRVFNFNYTNTFEIYEQLTHDQERLFSPNYVHKYMHGNIADRDIVIGANRDTRMGKDNFILKSSSADYSPPPDYRNTLLSTKHVEIFGHSFGDSDREYFEFFFRRLLEDPEFKPQIRIYTKDKASLRRLRSQLNSFVDDRLTEISISKEIQFFRTAEFDSDDWELHLRSQYGRNV